jgi:hypothetical protein
VGAAGVVVVCGNATGSVCGIVHAAMALAHTNAIAARRTARTLPACLTATPPDSATDATLLLT